MNKNSTYYHSKLSKYFESKPLYLDEPLQEKPNIRKLVEQPGQQTKGRLWNKLVKTLTEHSFIETKSKAGMIYMLVTDYDDAIRILPESREDSHEILKYKTLTNSYTKKLIEYSKTYSNSRNWSKNNLEVYSRSEQEEINLPKPPPLFVIHPFESKTKKNFKWSQLDCVKSWGHFVGTHIQQIINAEEPVFQLAWNSVNSGPIIELLEKNTKGRIGRTRIWFRLRNRPEFNKNPVCSKVLEGHQGKVTAVTITHDGQRAVSASEDGTIRSWDLVSGKCLQIIDGHSKAIRSISITPDGLYAISGSDDNTLRLWNLETSKCLKIFLGHSDAVNAVSLTPDVSWSASGSSDKTIRLWNLKTGECFRVLSGHKDVVSAIAITPDFLKAVSGSLDETLRVWDLTKGKCLKKLKMKEGTFKFINTVSITLDGKLGATGSDDDVISLWDLKIGKCLSILKGHTNMVRGVSITPNGLLAVSASSDKSLRVWNLKTSICQSVLEGHTDMAWCVDITPDGRIAVSGSWDKSLRIWNLSAANLKDGYENHTKWVGTTIFSPNGRQVASGGGDKYFRLWNFFNGKCQMILTLHSVISTLTISQNSQNAVSGGDRIICIWNLSTNECIKVLEGHSDFVRVVKVTPDGSRVVSGSDDTTVRVWNIYTGKCLSVLNGHTEPINKIYITLDGRYMVSATMNFIVGGRAVSRSRDNSIRLWDLSTGKFLNALFIHTDMVMSLSITPDGKRVISGGMDKKLIIFDLLSGSTIRVLSGHTAGITCIALTRDGKRAVSGSFDMTLRLWDLETGKCLRVLLGHNDGIQNVSISVDDIYILSGSWDKTIRLWNLSNGKCLAVSNLESSINCLDVHGSNLVVGERGGRVNMIAIENYSPDRPIITASKLWLFDGNMWDNKLTTCCPLCGHQFTPPASVLDTIQKIAIKAGLRPEQSPCLELTDEAWEEPGLMDNCPKCGEGLKFNPFFAGGE